MNPLRRGSDKTRRDVEAVLDATYPGASAGDRLHALVAAIYRSAVLDHRGGRNDVVQRAGARGVTDAKLGQILRGDLTGIKWSALEAVLTACDAADADIEAAQPLFDRAQTSPGPMIPPPGATPWTAGIDTGFAGAADDWVPARDRPPTTPAGPTSWAWAMDELDDPGRRPGAGHDVQAEQDAGQDVVAGDVQDVVSGGGTVTAAEAAAAEVAAEGAVQPIGESALDGAAETTVAASLGSDDTAADGAAADAAAEGTPVKCGRNVPDCALLAAVSVPREYAAPDVPATGNDTTVQPPTDVREETGPAPARHSPGSQKVLAPDPQTATTVADFVKLMKKYRAFTGDRPYREMAKACEEHPKVERAYSYASFSTIGNNGKLPKRDLLRAYIAGCGGSNTDIERWTQAHQRLSVQITDPVPDDSNPDDPAPGER